MKYIKLFSAAAVAAILLAACVSSPKVAPQPSSITKADVDSASYALGVYLAQMIQMNGLGDLNMSKIVKGCNDYLKYGDEKFDVNFVNERMSSFLTKKREAAANENKKKGEDFLAKNAKAEGVVTTESGLQYKILHNGNGDFPTSARDTVTAHYTLTSVDGEVIESSRDMGEPITFPLTNVIQGWIEGMQLIDEGGQIMLYIPSDLAYGENGPNGPNETLVFDIELIEVKHASED